MGNEWSKQQLPSELGEVGSRGDLFPDTGRQWDREKVSHNLCSVPADFSLDSVSALAWYVITLVAGKCGQRSMNHVRC